MFLGERRVSVGIDSLDITVTKGETVTVPAHHPVEADGFVNVKVLCGSETGRVVLYPSETDDVTGAVECNGCFKLWH